MKSLLSLLFVVVALAGIGALPAQAQVPGPHPGYLRALSDLRYARFLVSRDNPGPRDHYVIDEIDKAIGEIKQASIDDGKNLEDHPPVDANLDYRGRFHKALELLGHAHEDVSKFEDNVFATGLQHRAVEHIDKAHRELKNIIDSWR
jgi:hypothetical protein